MPRDKSLSGELSPHIRNSSGSPMATGLAMEFYIWNKVGTVKRIKPTEVFNEKA